MMFGKSRRTTHFLTKEETERIMAVVRDHEQGTSGEIRICVESHCPYMDPLQRAAEIFHHLKMFHTKNRNAVLIYMAYEDHDFALFADKAAHEHIPILFWQEQSKLLARHFYEGKMVEGITHCITSIGSMLKVHFPSHGENKNELPDEIIFGK